MFRKLLLPIAATALLAGCVTSAPYGYRSERGDYYYGRPSVEYRHHGVYPGYGYPYYGPYRPGYYGGYPGYYGYPYGHGYYGPRYGYPYYYPPVYRPRPGGSTQPDTRPDGGPWRHVDELRRRGTTGTTPGGVGPAPSTYSPPPQPQPRMEPRVRRSDEGSSMGQAIRRAREEGIRPSSAQDE